MITTIRAAAVVLAGAITWSAWTGLTNHTTSPLTAFVAFDVAAAILLLCWGLGRLDRRHQENHR